MRNQRDKRTLRYCVQRAFAGVASQIYIGEVFIKLNFVPDQTKLLVVGRIFHQISQKLWPLNLQACAELLRSDAEWSLSSREELLHPEHRTPSDRVQHLYFSWTLALLELILCDKHLQLSLIHEVDSVALLFLDKHYLFRVEVLFLHQCHSLLDDLCCLFGEGGSIVFHSKKYIRYIFLWLNRILAWFFQDVNIIYFQVIL